MRKHLTVKAYPFIINILDNEEIIASHSRSYERHQDVIDPLHYLALLEQRPGAFEHARPMRQLRASWPPVFEEVLARLQRDEGLGIREFVRVLRLLETHPCHQLEAAMRDALAFNTVNRDAIELILRQYSAPELPPPPLDLSRLPPFATDRPVWWAQSQHLRSRCPYLRQLAYLSLNRLDLSRLNIRRQPCRLRPKSLLQPQKPQNKMRYVRASTRLCNHSSYPRSCAIIRRLPMTRSNNN